MPSTAAFRYPRVLSIAGSDSGGGAGIQADLKTFAALGCFGMTAITALTAQNTLGVRSIHAVPLQILARPDRRGGRGHRRRCRQDRHAAFAPRRCAPSPARCDRHGCAQVVLDPVMVATSGAVLIDREAVDVLVRELFPLAAVVTPNLDEAALLVGPAAAQRGRHGGRGARAAGNAARARCCSRAATCQATTVSDLLLGARRAPAVDARAAHRHAPTRTAPAARCPAPSPRHLALGADLAQAVQRARDFVRGALAAGATVRTGAGSGPLNHGYAPQAMQLPPLP